MMKPMFLISTLFALTLFTSCGGGENEITEDSIVASDENGNALETPRVLQNVITDGAIDFNPDSCAKETPNDWDNFIGIPYGMSEIHLDSILGPSTGGRYSDDSTFFVFYYKGVERVPISVWSNSQTTQIETIFLEVTSFVQYFEEDVDAVTEYYGLRSCDTQFLGMQPKEVKAILGTPTKEEKLKDEEGKEIISLEYDSDDFKKVVSFRFFESQDYYCSLIMVNWFY